MARLVLIGGYARSGKSSTMEALKALGAVTASTTDTLYYTYVFPYFRVMFPAFEHWSNTSLYQWFAYDKSPDLPNGWTTRQFSIFVAENIVVPMFGRKEAIVRPALEAAIESNRGSDIYLQSLNRKEAGMSAEIASEYDYEVVCFNIRSKEEQGGVDSRDFLPGLDILRDKLTPVEVAYHIMEIVKGYQ